MCKSKKEGGFRCSIQEQERLQKISAKLAAAKALGDPERIVNLEGRLAVAERDYDLTRCGREELARKAEDESLSSKERSVAADRLNVANTTLVKQKVAREKAFQKQEALRKVLAEAGVGKEQIESVVALGVSEDQNRWLRPARYYKQLTAKLSAEKKNVLAALDQEEARIWTTSAKEGWSKEDTNKAIEALEAKRVERLAPLTRKLQDARFSYNCTAEGQEKMRNKLSTLSAGDYKAKARIRWSLESAERYHRERLTHRERRTLFNRRIKEVMAEVGADPKTALDAYRKPDPASLDTSRTDPYLIKAGMPVHLTPSDRNQVLEAFRASAEYKESGEKGINTFLTNRLRQDPRVLHTGTIEDANAGVEIFQTPASGRNPTNSKGTRNQRLTVSLTQKESGELKETAASLEMDFSSYGRCLLLGTDPFAHQNDRSPQHREMKTRKMKKLLGDD